MSHCQLLLYLPIILRRKFKNHFIGFKILHNLVTLLWPTFLVDQSAPGILECVPSWNICTLMLFMLSPLLRNLHGSLHSFTRVSTQNSCLWRGYHIKNSTTLAFSLTIHCFHNMYHKLKFTIDILINSLHLLFKYNLPKSKDLDLLSTAF